MTEQARITRFRENAAVDRGGGVRTVYLVRPLAGADGLMTGITEFSPGSALPMHFHNCAESVSVLEGEATFDDGGTEHELRVHDATYVPAGVHHRFINRGPRTMRILFIYASTAPTRTLVDTGQTFAVGTEAEWSGTRARPAVGRREATGVPARPPAAGAQKRLDHVGIVVTDLAKSSAAFEAILGVSPEPGVSRRDLVSQFFTVGAARVELIEVIDPVARSRRLGDAAAKIEHVAFEVEDVAAALHEMAALGIRATAPPRLSAGSLTFWTDPETSEGVSLQFLEKLPG